MVNGKLKRLKDKKNGNGEYYYNDNTRYVGTFCDDKLNEKGKFYHFDYSCFTGMFKNNLKHGVGELVKKNGTVVDQIWDFGILTSENIRQDTIERNITLDKSVKSVKCQLTEQESSDLGFDIDEDKEPILNGSTTQSYIKNAGPETLSMIDFKDRLGISEAEIYDTPITKWGEVEIAVVLEKCGLFDYIENFTRHKIKGKALLLLKDEDMEEIGVTKIGERIRLRDLILKLRKIYEQQKVAQKKSKKKNLSPLHSKKRACSSNPPLFNSENEIIVEESDSYDSEKTKREVKTTKSFQEVKPLSELKVNRKSSNTSIQKFPSKKNQTHDTLSLQSNHSIQSERTKSRKPPKLLTRSRSVRSLKVTIDKHLRTRQSTSEDRSAKSLHDISVKVNRSSPADKSDVSLNETSSGSSDSDDSGSVKEHRNWRFKFDYNDEIGPNLRNFLINKDDLEISEHIGEGAYGQVFRGRYLKTDVAVKIFNKNKLKYKIRKNFIQEAELLCSFRSPFIVLFMGFCLNYKDYMIITEYMSQGSLYDLIHIKRKKFATDMIMNIIEQVAHGMNHLHEKKVLHCDLKSSNILVS